MSLQPPSPSEFEPHTPEVLASAGLREDDRERARLYMEKHRPGFSRKLSHWRSEQLARRALKMAGEPGLVLDLPSGAGRFWPVLAEHGNRVILAGDHSPGMLAVAQNSCSPEIIQRITPFQTSALSIGLPENAVDCIFCMRLLHYSANREQRLNVLREFRRVTRDTLIVSLWVDGNFKAWKRKRTERQRLAENRAKQNRFVVTKAGIESEFREAGFTIVNHQDFLPGFSMWRVYVLRKKF